MPAEETSTTVVVCPRDKYGGWTCKELAAILAIHPSKITQALDPWREKLGKLARADWQRLLAMMLYAAGEQEALERIRRRLEPMSEPEIEARVARARLRMDRISSSGG